MIEIFVVGIEGGFIKAYITDIETYKQKIEVTIKYGGDQLLLQGGHHPELGLSFYTKIFSELKKLYPQVKLHALGPPEVAHITKLEGMTHTEVLKALKDSESFDAFNGLAKNNPKTALALTISMCSLAGIPLTAGFFGKFFIFTTAINQGFYWLIGIAILNAVIAFWYYFRVIIAMYMKSTSSEDKIEYEFSYKLVLWIAAIATLLFGMLPGILSGLL